MKTEKIISSSGTNSTKDKKLGERIFSNVWWM